MRDALKDSLERHPGVFEGYVKGSILICLSCAHPIYRLEATVSVGAKLSVLARVLRPVTAADLADLADRDDIDPGVRALCKQLTPQQRKVYADSLEAPKMGEPALCPRCQGALVQGRTAETSDTADRAFVIEPLFIPPRGFAAMAIRPGQVH